MPDIVRLDHVIKEFTFRAGVVRAVDDVSFGIEAGEIVGLVGESGSGKSTIARLIAGLQQPTSGTVVVRDHDLATIDPREMKLLRRRMQMVFQNPYGSLLPHFTAAGNVMEPLRIHGIGNDASRRRRAAELFGLVGIRDDAGTLYPRQFSGGEQQRIAIARALALEPDLLIYDEPTSSLDVSIQAQIIELLQGLHERLGVAGLFISHNLAVIERVADRVLVIKDGSVVEGAPTRTLFADPRHHYTRELIEAVLPVRTDHERLAGSAP